MSETSELPQNLVALRERLRETCTTPGWAEIKRLYLNKVNELRDLDKIEDHVQLSANRAAIKILTEFFNTLEVLAFSENMKVKNPKKDPNPVYKTKGK